MTGETDMPATIAASPLCAACKEVPGSEPGSGQHLLVGASMCRDCFLEWYDGDRQNPHENNTPEAIGEWVRRKRAERQGIPTIGATP